MQRAHHVLSKNAIDLQLISLDGRVVGHLLCSGRTDIVGIVVQGGRDAANIKRLGDFQQHSAFRASVSFRKRQTHHHALIASPTCTETGHHATLVTQRWQSRYPLRRTAKDHDSSGYRNLRPSTASHPVASPNLHTRRALRLNCYLFARIHPYETSPTSSLLSKSHEQTQGTRLQHHRPQRYRSPSLATPDPRTTPMLRRRFNSPKSQSHDPSSAISLRRTEPSGGNSSREKSPCLEK
jgi:hypothetical protein